MAILFSSAAHASQIEILSIQSGWQVESIVDVRGTGANVSGDGTNTIRWGRSFPGHRGRSGFNFQETSVGSTQAQNTLFNVGTFTHMNRVIFQGEHVDEARLNMTITARFDDNVERTFETSYLFSLLETPNYRNPNCANGEANNLDRFGRVQGGGSDLNRNGCADRVRLLQNDALTDEFTANGLTYSFELFGFGSGPEFWTVEELINTTWLQARFIVDGEPPVSPIPLPAGAWLLIGALGGLGLLRRRARRG
jgi:hypothetical protein